MKKYIQTVIFTTSVVFALIVSAQDKIGGKAGEYEVSVTLLNDSTYTFISDIHTDKETDKPFVFRNNCEQIYASQTKGISLKNKDGNTYKGLSANGEWYFELFTGKINCYTNSPGKQNIKFLYFSKNGGNPVPYSRNFLKGALKDNATAYPLLKKHFFMRSAQRIFLFGGLATMASVFVFPDANDNVRIVAGVGGACLSTLSLLFDKPVKNYLTRAIEVYDTK